MSTLGKMEITVKITEFPTNVKTNDNGWKQFEINASGRIVTITVKPKLFKKLESAQADYPQWICAVTGGLGEKPETGFVLDNPSLQVFERKSKETLQPTTVATNAASAAAHP